MPGEAEQNNTTQESALPTSIIVTTPLGTEAIPCERVVTCVAEGKNTVITCAGDIKPRRVFHGLAELETMLLPTSATSCNAGTRFFRCHRSHIINLDYCRSWGKSGKEAIAHLTYGDTILEKTVSRTYKDAFVRVWTEYVQGRRKG